MFCISMLLPLPKSKSARLLLAAQQDHASVVNTSSPRSRTPSESEETSPKLSVTWKEEKPPQERAGHEDQSEPDHSSRPRPTKTRSSTASTSSTSKPRSRCASLVSDGSSTIVSTSSPPGPFLPDLPPVESVSTPPLTPPEEPLPRVASPLPQAASSGAATPSRRSSTERRYSFNARLPSMKIFRTKSKKGCDSMPSRTNTQTPPPPYTAPPFHRSSTERQSVPTSSDIPLQRSHSETRPSTSSSRARSVEFKERENEPPSGEVFRTTFVNPFRPKSRRSASASLGTSQHNFIFATNYLFQDMTVTPLKDIKSIPPTTVERSRRSFGSYFNFPAQAATFVSSKTSLRRARSGSRAQTKQSPREVPRTQPYGAPYFAVMPCDVPSRPHSPRKSISSSTSNTPTPLTQITLDPEPGYSQPVSQSKVPRRRAEPDSSTPASTSPSASPPDATALEAVNALGLTFPPPSKFPNRSVPRNAATRHRVTVSESAASVGGARNARSGGSITPHHRS